MITLQVFLLGLMAVSTLTGLATEAIKNLLDEYGLKYYSNTLAGFVALVVSIIVGVFYVLINGMEFTSSIFVYLFTLVFMSWLCAMVGYDKVIQAIGQFKSYEKGENNEQ